MKRSSMSKKTKKKSSHGTGQAFLKYIQTGTPKIPGFYLCYIKDVLPESIKPIPMSRLIVTQYLKNGWEYPYNIAGWMGPLPILSVDELELKGDIPKKGKTHPKSIKKAQELSKTIYCIGTKKQAALSEWEDGPFPQITEAFGIISDKGMIMWEVYTDNKLPTPEFIWRNNGWGNVGPKDQIKIQKMVKIIRKKHGN